MERESVTMVSVLETGIGRIRLVVDQDPIRSDDVSYSIHHFVYNYVANFSPLMLART